MLQAGANVYSETLYSSQDLLNKLNPNAAKGSIFDPGTCSIPTDKECMPLRALQNLVTKDPFRTLLYCTLTGISVRTYYTIQH